MNLNKKLNIVFILFIIIPLIVFFLNSYSALNSGESLSSYKIQSVGNTTGWISFLGSILLFYLNYSNQSHRTIWYVIATIVFFFTIAILILLDSFSKGFGFF